MLWIALHCIERRRRRRRRTVIPNKSIYCYLPGYQRPHRPRTTHYKYVSRQSMKHPREEFLKVFSTIRTKIHHQKKVSSVHHAPSLSCWSFSLKAQEKKREIASRTKNREKEGKEKVDKESQASSSAMKVGMAHRCLSSSILRLNKPRSFMSSSTSS
jgi:hypothetical protein